MFNVMQDSDRFLLRCICILEEIPVIKARSKQAKTNEPKNLSTRGTISTNRTLAADPKSKTMLQKGLDA